MRTRFSNGFYHEQGIYFGMPFEDYCKDWSLGSSDLINLIISPSNFFWHHRANPNRRERGDTQALRYGRAIHKAVLEGHLFDQEYGRKPPLPEEGWLVTWEDLKARCEELGLPKSGTKSKLIERIRQTGDTTPIYDEIVAKYKEEMGDRTLLDADVYNEVMLASTVIKNNQHLTNAFDGGYSEVSVFFEHMGVPCRARFDYLKPSVVVDLKSIRNHLRQEWKVAVANAIMRHKYTIQATEYLQARAAVSRFIKEGKVFGNPIDMPNKRWLEAVANEDEFSFYWIFYQAEGAPLTLAIRFDHRDDEFVIATNKIHTALDKYKAYLTEFGSDFWFEAEMPIQFQNLGLPNWTYMT